MIFNVEREDISKQCSRMDSGKSGMYPLNTETTLMRGIDAFQRTSLAPGCVDRPIVRAAGIVQKESATEIVDVNKLSQKSTSVIQYVEVADVNGHLYCVDGDVSTFSWIKIIAFANDCQSCNVILVLNDKGVVLKATRCITPGEPLSMWFTEAILAMLNIPFLTPANIQGQNRYICHLCNDLFEYPNPLKIHLALQCNQLEINHLWIVLAKEFCAPKMSNPSFNLFPQSQFSFQLSNPVESQMLMNASALVTSDSSQSSDQASPTRSNHISPDCTPTQVSPSSSNPPVITNYNFRPSAFTPYANQESALGPMAYAIPAPLPPMSLMAHAAQMETLVSNLGKTKRGHLCIYCGKVYSRKYGLKIHIRTHTGYKPLKCMFCLRPFGDPSNLNKHVRLHTDGAEAPYKCNFCGKILGRRRDLERHLRSRHQENADVTDSSSEGADT